jgi:hypothetical protein
MWRTTVRNDPVDTPQEAETPFWAVTVRANWRFFTLKTATQRTLIMSTTTKQENRPMVMKNPPHPGTVVLQECTEPLGLTITQAARA